MKVFFRVDASDEIGTGHVVRCITLAERLRAEGCDCSFVTRAHRGHLGKLIASHHFKNFLLPCSQSTCHSSDQYGPWLGASLESDAEDMISIIRQSLIDWLIVDHYAIDKRWENLVRPYCKRIAVIDDIANRDHDCDLLLDQNLVGDAEKRYATRVPQSCDLLLGPTYALLQPEYAKLHNSNIVRRHRDKVKRILVYFGGADKNNLTGEVVDGIIALERPDIKVDVVVNDSHPKAGSIFEKVVKKEQFIIHGRLPTLSSLMLNADLSIGAAGTTTWERCCLGLPTMVITLASNQVGTAAELHRRGVIRWIGDQRNVTSKVLMSELKDLIDYQFLNAWSQSCFDLVDGEGTGRVIDKLTGKKKAG